MASAQSAGKLGLLCVTLSFVYYSLWIFVTPFYEDGSLTALFPRRELAVQIPVAFGVFLLSVLVGVAGILMMRGEEDKLFQVPRSVTVFGSSQIKPGCPEYIEGERLGRLIAEQGLRAVSGGYGGVMEAVSKGVALVGGEAVGVLVPSLFPQRYTGGNPYLTSSIPTLSLAQRLEKLTSLSRLFICLPGQLGTLAEATLAWNLAYIDLVVHKQTSIRIICWRVPFERFVKETVASMDVPDAYSKVFRFVNSAEEAAAEVAVYFEELSPATPLT